MRIATVSARELTRFGIWSPSFYTLVDEKWRIIAEWMPEKQRNNFISRMPDWFIEYIEKQLGFKLSSYPSSVVWLAAGLAFKDEYTKYLKLKIQMTAAKDKESLSAMKKL